LDSWLGGLQSPMTAYDALRRFHGDDDFFLAQPPHGMICIGVREPLGRDNAVEIQAAV